MSIQTERIELKITPELKRDFKRGARILGRSMSQALKTMIRDFLTGKITLTKYPWLDAQLQYKLPAPKRPVGRPRKYPPIEDRGKLIEAIEQLKQQVVSGGE